MSAQGGTKADLWKEIRRLQAENVKLMNDNAMLVRLCKAFQVAADLDIAEATHSTPNKSLSGPEPAAGSGYAGGTGST